MADNETVALLYRASIAPLSKTDEIELAKRAAAGDKRAREKLILANIRYALKCAKRYKGHGLDEEDLCSEAVIGLIKAVDNFDFTKGFKVITFANSYIMNEILSSCNKSGYILRQSDGRLRKIAKINKARKLINPKCSGRELIEKISEKTGFDEKLISELLEETQQCISLDVSGEEGSNTLNLAVIPDTVSCSPEETVINNSQREQFYEKLEELDPIEKQTICMRYGLLEYKQPYSLTEIGEELGESKQYIYYIDQRAKDKLRASMRLAS